MTWTQEGINAGLAQWNSKSAGTSFTSAAVAANAAVDDVIIVIAALDNTQTTDGDSTLVSSVTDSTGGNTYSKIKESTNGQGSAAAGATISCWFTTVASALTSGVDTITVNHGSVTARGATALLFHKTNSGAATVTGTPVATQVDGADVASTTLSGLANQEHLFVHAIAHEGPNTDTWTGDASWTSPVATGTTGGNSASNMSQRCSWRILTGTSASSDPSCAAVDHSHIIFALDEPAAASFTPIDPLGMSGFFGL